MPLSRKMLRIPGVVASSSMALEPYHSGAIEDVNGYYRELGLAPFGVVPLGLTWLDIQAAYRRAMRACHPDTGVPDVDRMERLKCAMDCLANSFTRAQYNRLRYPSMWLDRLVLAQMTPREKEAVAEVSEEPEQMGYCVYIDAELIDLLPHRQHTANWMRALSIAFREEGRLDFPLRLGYSLDGMRIERPSWGVIAVVPIASEASPEVASEIVRTIISGE